MIQNFIAHLLSCKYVNLVLASIQYHLSLGSLKLLCLWLQMLRYSPQDAGTMKIPPSSKLPLREFLSTLAPQDKATSQLHTIVHMQLQLYTVSFKNMQCDPNNNYITVLNVLLSYSYSDLKVKYSYTYMQQININTIGRLIFQDIKF